MRTSFTRKVSRTRPVSRLRLCSSTCSGSSTAFFTALHTVPAGFGGVGQDVGRPRLLPGLPNQNVLNLLPGHPGIVGVEKFFTSPLWTDTSSAVPSKFSGSSSYRTKNREVSTKEAHSGDFYAYLPALRAFPPDFPQGDPLSHVQNPAAFITFPSNMLKFSPSSFRVMVWVSATFKIVCFSSTRPWSFSA